MHQIGLFSKMNQITIKTLHYYDEIGLLKPEFIDEETGYRYYSSNQSYVLYRIRFLKQLGFNLEDIQQIIQGESKEGFFLQKKLELLEEISDKAKMLGQIEYYLLQSQNEPNEYEVLLKELPECIVLSRRITIPRYENLFEEMGKSEKIIQHLKCTKTKPSYCFNIYHNKEYKEENVDVEICESVTTLGKNGEDYSFIVKPAIETAAYVLHKGSYSELPKAYFALTSWIEANQYEVIDLPRESYIEGMWNETEVNNWLTEIQFPVLKKS